MCVRTENRIEEESRKKNQHQEITNSNEVTEYKRTKQKKTSMEENCDGRTNINHVGLEVSEHSCCMYAFRPLLKTHM